jgi:3-oxoacyl-[acyl-carrier protein] reductase
MKLAGNVALVTGSGRRMGRAMALALARNGANVVINAVADREAMERTVADARALGVKAIGCLADIRDRPAIEAMAAQAKAELGGPIDILVNNPAPRPETPFENISPEEWRHVVSTILDGAFVCTQTVIGDMLAAGRGTIINITGLSGQAGEVDRAHVVAAKAGLIGLTKALAREYATHGITVNSVSPTRITGGGAGKTGLALVGRQGTQDEVASLVCYLASEDARFITGQVYAINGGQYM